jgi:hypothetical protein
MRVRAVLAIAVAALALLVSGPTAAQAAVPGGGVRLMGSPVDDQQPAYHWLATIHNPGRSCSGTLIDPSWVLTFQQCFTYDVTPTRSNPVGPDDYVTVAGAKRKITAFFHSQYLALVRLDSPVSSPQMVIPALAFADPPKFAYARFFGGGEPSPGSVGPAVYREAPVMIDAFDPAEWTGATLFARDELSPYDAPGAGFSDAGGALLYGGQLAGVFSGLEVSRPGNDATVPYRDLAYFSMARNRDWIESTIRNYVAPRLPFPVPTCSVWICG